MTNRGFQAVLFDMDGVVLDTMDRHAACWSELLSEKGFQVDLEFILRHEGCLRPQVLCELAGPDQNLTPDQAAGLMAELLPRQARMYIERHADEVRPFPEAVEVIQRVAHNGLPLALVTSSSRPVVESSLGPELYNQFTHVVTSEDVSRHKPEPEPYLAAARALSVDQAACLVVENAPAGIQAANAAGATCYALTTTLKAQYLDQAARVFDSHLELARYAGLI